MTTATIIWLIIGVIIIIMLGLAARGWVRVYNKFQYWITRAQRKFADIDVVMQQRLDNIHALAQIVKKYDIHEYKTLKDVIEARSRWSKDADLNEKVKMASEVENNYLKLQAIFEKYPNLKADKMHVSLLEKDSNIERNLRKTRLEYNRVAQQYNERTRKFPRNIVARVHSFKELDYLTFEGQETFAPKEIFDDES
ncbi:LemA family protein [Dehalococcoides mccartyi]|uniref:LemA family protein n=1 Tax=Dehalococcoides mccartyi TaxID=61435 RepID=UPI00107E714D|nr:LemA family protein [Dehalococcoides mccartyi]QBX63343.1 LemA family protein [Dehalococcoides mccartyi]